jgi:Tfp pilus assembly protein PilF
MSKKARKINTANKSLNNANQIRTKFWERKYAFEIVVFLFSFLLFANSISNDYNIDDDLVTINHPITSKGVTAIAEIFSSPYYKDAAGYSYEYRPVVLSTFAFEHDLVGDNPHWSHLISILLYSITCVLLFNLLRFLFKEHSPFLAFLISLLFVAHPAHTEVVCSIKNRDEILALLLSILSLKAAIYAYQKKKLWAVFLVPTLFILAIFSKGSALSFALIIPLTLLFFTEISFLYFFLIVVALGIPTVYVASRGDEVFQFKLLLFFISAGSLVYPLFNFRTVVNFAKHQKKQYLNVKDFSFSYKQESEQGEQLLQNYFPPVSFFSWRIVLFFSAMMAFFIIAVSYGLTAIMLFVGFILFSLLFRKEQTYIWWSYLCIMALSLYCFIFMGLYNDLFFVQLFFVTILLSCIYGSKTLLLPAIATSIILVLYSQTKQSETFISILPMLILVILSKAQYRWKWLILLVCIAGTFVGTNNIETNLFQKIKDQIPFYTLVIAFIPLYIGKGKTLVPKLFAAVSIFSITFASPINFYNKSFEKDVKVVTKSIIPETISRKDNRPLNYVEVVLTNEKHLSKRIGTSLEIMLCNFKKVALPYPLAFYYGYSYIIPLSILSLISISSLLLHLLFLFVAIYFYKDYKPLSFGIFIYLIASTSISNFFQPLPGMVADRFLLIPSIGFLIAIVFLLYGLSNQSIETEADPTFQNTNWPKYLYVFVLTAYTILSLHRNGQWKNYLTLARNDIQYVQNSSQAHNLLALRLMKESYEVTDVNEQNLMHKEALLHFKQAVEIYPPFFNATYDIARVFSILNQTDSAIVYYQRTLQLDSTFTNANMALGEIYFQQQRLDDARANFEKLIKAFPTNSVGYDKVSYIYFLQKEYLKSIAINKMAIEKMPSDPQPCIAIAKAFYTMQQFDSSRVYLKKALQINPSHQEANALLQNLGSR